VKVLLTFETIGAALDCEGILKDAGTPCKVIPVPRSLGVSCNYAVTLETEDPRLLCDDLRGKGAEYNRIFQHVEDPGKSRFFKSETWEPIVVQK
jgi:hypothetical protein